MIPIAQAGITVTLFASWSGVAVRYPFCKGTLGVGGRVVSPVIGGSERMVPCAAGFRASALLPVCL